MKTQVGNENETGKNMFIAGKYSWLAVVADQPGAFILPQHLVHAHLSFCCCFAVRP